MPIANNASGSATGDSALIDSLPFSPIGQSRDKVRANIAETSVLSDS